MLTDHNLSALNIKLSDNMLSDNNMLSADDIMFKADKIML
jgi:hypothetical protein